MKAIGDAGRILPFKNTLAKMASVSGDGAQESV